MTWESGQHRGSRAQMKEKTPQMKAAAIWEEVLEEAGHGSFPWEKLGEGFLVRGGVEQSRVIESAGLGFIPTLLLRSCATWGKYPDPSELAKSW